jgi:hypothetical protein
MTVQLTNLYFAAGVFAVDQRCWNVSITIPEDDPVRVESFWSYT